MYLAHEMSLICLGKRSADFMWNNSISLGCSTYCVRSSQLRHAMSRCYSMWPSLDAVIGKLLSLDRKVEL